MKQAKPPYSYKINQTIWILIIKIIFLEIFIVSFFSVLYLFINNLSLLSLIAISFNIFTLLIIIFRWLFRYYTIAPHFLGSKTGIFIKKYVSYDLKLIQEITLKQSLFGQILDYGNLVMFNPTTNEECVFRYIPNPAKHLHSIKQNIVDLENNNNSSGGNMVFKS